MSRWKGRRGIPLVQLLGLVAVAMLIAVGAASMARHVAALPRLDHLGADYSED